MRVRGTAVQCFCDQHTEPSRTCSI